MAELFDFESIQKVGLTSGKFDVINKKTGILVCGLKYGGFYGDPLGVCFILECDIPVFAFDGYLSDFLRDYRIFEYHTAHDSLGFKS